MSIANLLAELDERTIARKIGIPHDEARMQYSLRSNTVGSYEEFSRIIADYYSYHFTTCVSLGEACHGQMLRTKQRDYWSVNRVATEETS